MVRWTLCILLCCACLGIAQSPVLQHRRTASRPQPSSGAWTDSIPSGNLDSTESLMNPIVRIAYKVTLASGGTATGLRVYIRGFTSTSNLKIGIYDDNGAPNNLLGSGVVSVTGTGYATVTGLSVSVTATSYWVAFVAETASSIAQGYKVTGTLEKFSVGTAYTLDNPGAYSSSADETPSVGIFVQ